MKPKLGISLMPEENFLLALLPLLQNGDIDVVEWSFDTLFGFQEPKWLKDILEFYASHDNLLGHGVYYSIFDANWTSRQDKWLADLEKELSVRKYTHITEHFGFMNTDNFHQGVPLPISLHPKVVDLAKDRLSRLQNVVNMPIGIENLALAFSEKEIFEQNIFLTQIIEDIDGFLLLDLHNIYCQAHNFKIPILEILKTFPLHKVKELHLSGGSWQESIYKKGEKIRRDTHDDQIPIEIIEILPFVLNNTPHLEYIIIERLSSSLITKEEIERYHKDFYLVKEIIDQMHYNTIEMPWNPIYSKLDSPIINDELLAEQKVLTQFLYDKTDPSVITEHPFEYFQVKLWNSEMINTASEIIKKWNPY